ncbi:MAG: ComEC/Rec2 family competence protein [Planctomycetaceae bacterium]|nr:ComEC/Rec2 family competence protein [Planctomycetaceae bacterium]
MAPMEPLAKKLSPSGEKREPFIPRYQPLVLVLAAAAAGIVLDSYWPLPIWLWATSAVTALIVWGAATRAGGRHESSPTHQAKDNSPSAAAPPIKDGWFEWLTLVGSFAVLVAVASTGGAWHHCRWSLFAANDLGRYALQKAQPVCIEAVAVGSPRRLAAKTFDPMQGMPLGEEASRMMVDIAALRNGATWQPASGRAMLLIVGERPAIHAGDRLRCFVQLAAPRRPMNPGGFDDAARQRGEGVLSRLAAENPACVSVIARGNWLSLTRLLDEVRGRSDRLLEKYLDPQCAEMAEAVLLGQREQLEQGRIEDFMATGVIHLLVIAGLHVGILAGAFYWLLRRTPLPRGWTAMLIAAATIFYMLLVDAGPPVVRASVLVLLVCAATSLGRRSLSFNSLAAAALVVLVINPNHLFHAGAQLSFLSVAGLMWFAPRWMAHADDPLARLIERNSTWPERWSWAFRRSMRHMLLVSLTIWLLTMPLVMARFHLCTPVAIVLNTVVWLPMAAGLVGGAVLLVVGGMAPPLAHLCGGFCNVVFTLLESCVRFAERSSLGHLWLPGPPDWWLWCFYGGMGLVMAFPRFRSRRCWWLGPLAVWLLVWAAAAAWPPERGRLDCTFLSVKHGCAVLVELPSGKTLLYDAGQLGAPTASSRAISEYLWWRGLRRIDAIVLSHPDLDHFNAVPTLLERFSVGAIYVSPAMFAKRNQAVAALRAAIEQWGVPIREVGAGDRLDLGEECRLDVLHPRRRRSQWDERAPENANSLVLAIECFGRRILLPGDLESPGLDELLAEKPLACDVLLAPHHGSRKSNSPELARWCHPRWVVFSGDGRWNLPEIEAAYRAVGSNVLQTCDAGAIRVEIDAARIEVQPFLPRDEIGSASGRSGRP